LVVKLALEMENIFSIKVLILALGAKLWGELFLLENVIFQRRNEWLNPWFGRNHGMCLMGNSTDTIKM